MKIQILLISVLSLFLYSNPSLFSQNTMDDKKYLVSVDGNFQHYHNSIDQNYRQEQFTGTFGYFLNEKTMLGLGIQFSNEADNLKFVDDIGVGTRNNLINKRRFQPFVRRYFFNKNNFNIFYKLSLNIASEEFTQTRNYDGMINSSNQSSFEYATLGAYFGLGLEYHVSKDWVLFALSEAVQYQQELNEEVSTSENIVFEDASLNMSLLRDLRVGVGYYF